MAMSEDRIIARAKISPDARKDIFISYRRSGGSAYTQLVDKYLGEAFYNVFFDADLREGVFGERLLYSIRNCIDYLLILPPHALDRCKEPNDWLTQEIECALENKKNIIPIMLPDFRWPKAETLPESLRHLPDYNALKIIDKYFDPSMQTLVQMLHSKPFFVDAVLLPPKPKCSRVKLLLIALVAFTIGVSGTLITQRLLLRDQAPGGNTPVNVVETVQTPEASATETPAYVTGIKKGSVIDKAVRAILGIPSGDILEKDAEGITEIDLSGCTLTDISELSALTGLTSLDLHNNKITDLSALSALHGLESLLIYNNQVTSLQPLSGLTNLTELSAENNQIVDVSPLAELTALKKLFLQNNQITDVSPIRNLVNLTRLVLDGNPVTDFTPLRIFDTTVFQIPQV
jgi:hypothetical protein